MSGDRKAVVPVATLLRTQGLQFVRMLQGALRLFGLYSSQQGQAQALVKRALEALQTVLKETRTLSIGFQFDKVVLNSLPLADPSLSCLAGELVKRRIAFISFSAGIDEAGLTKALGLLATSPELLDKQGGVAAIQRAHPLDHARFVPVQAAGDEGSLAVITSAEEAAAVTNVPRWLLTALGQGKTGGASETVGPEQLCALGSALDPSLTAQQRALFSQLQEALGGLLRSNPQALSALLHNAHDGSAPQGRQLLESALLRSALAAAANGQDSQAEHMLRGLAALAEKPEELGGAIARASLPEPVRRRLQDYLAWLARPMAERLSALAGDSPAREYRWLAQEIENALDEEQDQQAGEWLLALYSVGGPVPAGERAELLAACQKLLARFCSSRLPGNARALFDAISALLPEEDSADAAAALVDSLAAIIRAAADQEEYALATAGAALIGQLAAGRSMAAEPAARLLPSLLRPERMARLVAACIDKEHDPAVSHNLVPLLKRVGEQAARELLARFENEAMTARRFRILHLLKLAGRAAVPPLLEKLDDARWYIVRDAVALLGEVGDAHLLERLAPALAHDEQRVQEAAIEAMLKSHCAERGRFLAQALPGIKPDLLEPVLDDLLLLKEPSAVPYVERLVRQPAVGVRPYLLGKAVAVMGAIETQDAVRCLLDLADETSLAPALRRAALGALARMQVPGGQQALEYFARTAADAVLAGEAQKLLPVWQYL